MSQNPKQDLIGMKFNRLTVKSYTKGKGWLCDCECGETRFVIGYDLTNGLIKSCGCYRRELGRIAPKTSSMKTGDVYSRLTIMESVRGEYNQVRFVCKCSCGNILQVDPWMLRSGGVKSCGCLKAERVAKLGKEMIKGDISGQYTSYTRYKYGAKNRNLEFQLSLEDFTKISTGSCIYCGREPFRKVKDFLVNGIDRIDSNIGYLKENCVPCCYPCNRIKGNMEADKFLSLVQLIAKHQLLN